MVMNTADVTTYFIADHQARLRALARKHPSHAPGSPSRRSQVTGELLMRLATQMRGQPADARQAASRTRMAAH